MSCCEKQNPKPGHLGTGWASEPLGPMGPCPGPHTMGPQSPVISEGVFAMGLSNQTTVEEPWGLQSESWGVAKIFWKQNKTGD